jgi:transcriptional regulator with XRE-family HTH domain
MQVEIVSKIRKLRKERGLTQPQMADLLHIDKSAYARLETGETYSWAKYLEEILTIFDITPEKFFEGIGQNVVNQKDFSFSNGAVEVGYVGTLHQENKEAYQKLIQTLEKEIEHLKEEIDFLLKMLEK